jgi:hypothetical protein
MEAVVTVPLALRVVNAPVPGVVAPTVPLILMLAVPEALVRTMADGVPSAGVISVGEVCLTKLPVPVVVPIDAAEAAAATAEASAATADAAAFDAWVVAIPACVVAVDALVDANPA